MDFQEVVCVVALLVKRQRVKKRKRKYWVHPVISHRLLKGQFHSIYEDLRAHPDKLKKYFRMNPESFDELVTAIGHTISFMDTNLWKCVPVEERVAVTLR